MEERIRRLNDVPVNPAGDYVLYWAQMNRRVPANHALLYAARIANDIDRPVLYYEGLTNSYPCASDRMHTFLLEGVPDTARGLEPLGIGYAFYLRRRTADANDILYRLAERASAVVTDDYPAFLAAAHNARVPARIARAYHAVDSSCVVPMSLFPKREWAAYTLRPKIRKLLPQYLRAPDSPRVRRRWTAPPPPWHVAVTPDAVAKLVASCEIDHSVPPSLTFSGSRSHAQRRLAEFLEKRLPRYAEYRNEPSAHATSNLSPYLHFGRLSSLEAALAARDDAHEHQRNAGEFLEELIVRRELAFNYARHVAQPDTLDNLPDWARNTLRDHAADARPVLYTREQFERAATHDALWNATQKELLLRGTIHGYYRMYWGKKLIEWSPTCQDAFETMVYLHDRYALDGRDPNTYANILWCFGLHDRPWPQRPVFGSVRYLSLEGMRRKTDVDAYIREIRGLENTGRDPFPA